MSEFFRQRPNFSLDLTENTSQKLAILDRTHFSKPNLVKVRRLFLADEITQVEFIETCPPDYRRIAAQVES
jgi:hypothetical protein